MDSTRNILVGITGGIAAYKTPELIRCLKKQGAAVKVVLTANARSLVGEEALRTVSQNPVYRDGLAQYDMDHIRLADWADWLVICPATANTIAKIAHGIADNLLTTLSLAIKRERVIIVPAMNTTMWLSDVTQANISLLQNQHAHVLPVGVGPLACETSGPGRMIDIEEIVDYVLSAGAASGILNGKRILISSGPTEEPIDPVRVLTNSSSGKMGAALARAALSMGAQVVVVSGPAREPLPSGARVVAVRTAASMHAALREELGSADIFIMAAAVSDFRPSTYAETKIPRSGSGNQVLSLVPNADILADLSKIKEHRFFVGFALETGDGVGRAEVKMRDKGCDMMILNHAESSLGRDTTQITILYKSLPAETVPAAAKRDVAETILNRIAVRMDLIHE